jgi:GTP-binding protein
MSVFPHVRFMISAHRPDQFPPDEGVEVAVAGRSNAGKSSAINAITGRRSLARTSKTPGQTQLLNFFELEPSRRLVDLPGYGYAKVPPAMKAHWERLVSGYLARRSSLTGLLLIVDARRGLNEGDLTLLHWAERDGRGAHILLSKSDKLTRNEQRQQLRHTQDSAEGLATVQLFSAHEALGIEEAREALRELLIKSPGDSGGRGTGAD